MSAPQTHGPTAPARGPDAARTGGLVVDKLVVEYQRDGYTIRPLDGLDLRANEGELVVLLGPSGTGKTTLLSCLGGILTPTAGTITLGDVLVTSLKSRELQEYRRTHVGFVFQAFNLIPSLSALENIAVPLMLGGQSRRAATARARDLLETVGLADRATHRPAHLSGGQQQRVAIARGLAGNPRLLLADEPTANLDYIQAESVIRLLRELRADGRIIVVSSHDARLIPVADRVHQMVATEAASDDPAVSCRFSKGTLIFEQGDRADRVYELITGEVDIVRVHADRSEEVLTRLHPGRYFGELGPLLGFPRSASARAATDVEVVSYGVTEFRHHLQSTHVPSSTARLPSKRVNDP